MGSRDYSGPGIYFITICALTHVFGRVRNGVMILNPFGDIARDCWTDIPKHFSHVRTDAFVVMPDHLHGILLFGGRPARVHAIQRISTGSLGVVVRSFKAAVAARINSTGRRAGIWQRNYFDRIVRSRADLDRVRRYIQDNPASWEANRTKRMT